MATVERPPNKRAVVAWSVDVNFGNRVGMSCGVRLMRYHASGSVYMAVQGIRDVFNIPKTTLRDALNRLRSDKASKVEDRPSILRLLKHNGFIGVAASKVQLIRVTQAVKLVTELRVDAHAIKVLATLTAAEPPPRPPAR